ncbi:hypothetical protein DFH28DRAFT_922778 [Melampsora americana]|nr:hypothetical protein DFH28DRAFT_922778 [Melampsora americana]
MRSGLQRVPNAVSHLHETNLSDSADSTSDASNTATRRRGSKKKTRSSQNRNQEVEIQAPPTTRKRKRPRLNDHQQQDNELDKSIPDIITYNTNEVPTLMNYQQLGLQWGIARAEQTLTDLKVPKSNRLSPDGLFEAQCLQSQYHLHKTMLCITLKCSRKVLDDALLEGPLAREPNMYTNYQTYSIPATTTQMPGKGVSEGFNQRNTTVGNTWTSYNKEERDVFTPRLFEPLCIATSEAYALTQTPLGIPAASQSADSTTGMATTKTSSRLTTLTNEELNKYVPIFKRLVNLQKVSRDMHEGRLWRHSGKSKRLSLERLMRKEISKIVQQLHALKSHFNLHFHLLLACLNPASSTSEALFQDEATSCERWARHQKKQHLLECFAFEATKAPEHIRPKRKEPKPPSESAVHQAQLRADLVLALNNLVEPYLRGGYLGKGDAHPKTPNLIASFEKKTFRGDFKLTFQRTPDSKITDLMLAKGTSALTNDEVSLWLDDIQSKRYTLVKVDKPKPSLSRSIKAQSTPTLQETQNTTSTPQETENDTFHTPE